ncbi:hypothetical protein H9623_01530 [Oerskovia sp. Sa1BUA8]|uniref:Alpha/beta hydrolase n=1 Tax=Oerskovia douganii TaxID=2762210 RepID=A0A9D5U5N6_9CELL|nr:hypothetical protein [Oerskovia douganii]MBE7698989.1 hypothetical protein [Oerskovia douganii]
MPRRTGLLVGVLAASCGALALAAAPWATGRVAIPAQGPWIVAVDGWPAGIDACAEDHAVEYAVTPLPLPPLPTTVALVPEAGREDVERVVRCLDRYVPSSGIDVMTVPPAAS